MPDPNDATPSSPGSQGQPPTTPPGDTQQAPPTTPAATPPGAKTVPESDLIAAKEEWKGKLADAEGKVRESETKLNDYQQQLLQATAKIETLEAGQAGNVSSAEELSRTKVELDTTKQSLGKANTDLLESKRQLIARLYNVPVDTLKDKDVTQLGNFEEALKVVAATKGIGNYAVGGGVGGGTAPQTNLERAASVIEATPERGVRNLPNPNAPPA